MKKYLLFFTGFLFCGYAVFAQLPQKPDKLYGELFKQVQMSGVFADSKTFVDCIAVRDPQEIMADYNRLKRTKFDLKKFVEENFRLPHTPQLNYITREKDVVMHIKNLWGVLSRESDTVTIAAGNSLLPLPFPYVVPGGRFREMYYWDSYFTMLGLKESNEVGKIEDMVKNFAWLINTYGHVPNGNRSYYLSRSQPPFFALMVEMLAEIKGDAVYTTYLPALEKEYRYWMQDAGKLMAGKAVKRVVKLKDGSLLNRYWDENPVPRQESYREDVETAGRAAGRDKKEMYYNLRAGAASGWDFSSRWFAGKRLESIQVITIIPVDLNSLLYKLELVIAKANTVAGNETSTAAWLAKAARRKQAIDKYCWNKTLKYYTDYNFKTARQTSLVTPAGMFPFCFYTGNSDYMSLLARQAAVQVKEKLLQPGGIVTTPDSTGQQWDAPNGWAPLQWMTIWGLDRCGQRELARDIASRWIKLNVDVFKRTGRLMEKYNVINTTLEAGGGEYASQDGFGWTNGVLLALINKYRMPQEAATNK